MQLQAKQHRTGMLYGPLHGTDAAEPQVITVNSSPVAAEALGLAGSSGSSQAFGQRTASSTPTAASAHSAGGMAACPRHGGWRAEAEMLDNQHENIVQ